MREIFVRELRAMLWIEQHLADNVLPDLHERAHSVDLRRALDKYLLETQGHVANLRRVFALVGEPDVPLEAPLPPPAEDGDFGILASVLRTEAYETASYRFLAHAAQALEVDGDAVRLLRLNMEQDAYAGEEAEHALVKLLAEKVSATEFR